jgi:hypothetical protein
VRSGASATCSALTQCTVLTLARGNCPAWQSVHCGSSSNGFSLGLASTSLGGRYPGSLSPAAM